MSMDIAQLIKDFQAERYSDRVAPDTIKNQGIDASRFLSFLQDKGEDLTSVGKPVFRQFRRHELDRGVSVGTWNRMASSLRTFFLFTQAEGLTGDLTADIPRIKDTSGNVVEIVSPEDLTKLENHLDNLPTTGTVNQRYFNSRIRLIWNLFFNDGVRVGELTKIHKQDFQKEALGTFIEIKGKGSRNRTIFIHPDTASLLYSFITIREEYIQARKSNALIGELFISARLQALSKRQIQGMITKLGQDLGIHLACHKLRKTAVSETVNNLTDLAELPLIAKDFGHTVGILEKHYLSPDRKKALNARVRARQAVREARAA